MRKATTDIVFLCALLAMCGQPCGAGGADDSAGIAKQLDRSVQSVTRRLEKRYGAHWRTARLPSTVASELKWVLAERARLHAEVSRLSARREALADAETAAATEQSVVEALERRNAAEERPLVNEMEAHNRDVALLRADIARHNASEPPSDNQAVQEAYTREAEALNARMARTNAAGAVFATRRTELMGRQSSARARRQGLEEARVQNRRLKDALDAAAKQSDRDSAAANARAVALEWSLVKLERQDHRRR